MYETHIVASFVRGKVPYWAGLFKALLANLGLARILISVLQLFGDVLCSYCLAFFFEFEKFQTKQKIGSEKH